MKSYTLDNCKDAAVMGGLTEPDGEEFYNHYAAQGWLLGNGLPITNLQCALVRWRNNGKKKKVAKAKINLFPISGKNCNCGMPAVYKAGGDYDNYYCLACAPQKIRDTYI